MLAGGRTIRSLRRGEVRGFGPRPAGCWAIWDREVLAGEASWCVRRAVCRRHSTQTTWRRSWRIWAPTHRDRAMVLAMLLGGLRAGEVRASNSLTWISAVEC